MKQNSRKLIPAIAMLVVAAVTLTSASYAWFTMSREVTAEGIQLTATAPTNLLIASGKTAWNDATDAGDYNSSTTVNALSTVGSNNGNAGRLIPVSSADGFTMVTVDKMTNSNGLANADAVVAGKSTDADGATKVPAVTATTDGYYIDIPLWIKSTGGDPVNVVLDSEKSVISMIDGETNKDLYLAARFSVLDRADNGTASLFAGKNDGYIFSPAARSYLNTTLGPIAGTEAVGEVWKGTAETAANFAFGKTNDKKLFTIPASVDPAAGQIQKLTVRIWLEGQDARCITNNSMQSFKVTVAFKDAATYPAP